MTRTSRNNTNANAFNRKHAIHPLTHTHTPASTSHIQSKRLSSVKTVSPLTQSKKKKHGVS